jgi:mRNA interferase MazF
MTLQRGDVVLCHYPFASGTGAKVRPALVVQNDQNNQRLTNVIVAAITTTTHRSGEPTQLLIDPSTPEGQPSGLLRPSVVSCENLATIEQSLVLRTIGKLPAPLMQQVNDCLKASLDLPSRRSCNNHIPQRRARRQEHKIPARESSHVLLLLMEMEETRRRRSFHGMLRSSQAC